MSTSGGASGSAFVKWGFLAAAAVLGIGYASHQYTEATKRAETEKAAARHVREAPPAAATTAVVVREKLGKEKRLYRFSDFGGTSIAVELRSDVDFYPKGGAVTITPPSPGKPWRDTPGTANNRGALQPGTYTVCKANSDAWGVEIWN